MCLTKITQGPNPEEGGEGYKAFGYMEGLQRGQLAPMILLNRGFEVGKWITDEYGGNLCATVGILDKCFKPEHHYLSGFHLFERKQDAEFFARYHSSDGVSYCVRKVRYRNVTAKGPQLLNAKINWDTRQYEERWGNCIVAREIFIEPEEREI
jgi:hypothetical protein